MDSAFSICSIVIFYSFVKGTAVFLTGKVCSVFFSEHSAYDHALYFHAFILRFFPKRLDFRLPTHLHPRDRLRGLSLFVCA